MEGYGKKVWLIPDMYWPEVTSEGPYVSHEAVCVLNTGSNDANISIKVFFEDQEPVEFDSVICKAQRTHHIRMDKLNPTKSLGKGKAYAALVISDVPVVVQYTRVDTTQAENAIMTSIAY